MTSKKQKRLNRRYIAILSLKATTKQSQENTQVEKPLKETPVPYTGKSGDGQLELTASPSYNAQNILTTITVEIADFTSNKKKPTTKTKVFKEIKAGAKVTFDSSGNFTAQGDIELKMLEAQPKDVSLLWDLFYGEKNQRKHVEGVIVLIPLSSANLGTIIES